MTFESLPAKIIQRVASLCAAETAISLSQCSHYLHGLCYNPVVFRGIANCNGHYSGIKESWDISFLPANTSARGFAEYAVADSKAHAWIMSQGVQEGQQHQNTLSAVSNLLQWPSVLANLGHPFIKRLDLSILIGNLFHLHLDAEELRALQLLVTATVLCIAEQSVSSATERAIRNIIDHMENLMFTDSDDVEYEYDNDFFTISDLILISRQFGHGGAAMRFPIPSKINPTRWCIGLPSPLSSWSSLTIDAAYRSAMTSKEFFEDGDWTGYCDRMSQGLCHFNFLGIFSFQTTNSEHGEDNLSNYHENLSVTGQGRDDRGDWTLTGKVYNFGRFHARKALATGAEDWFLLFTPWGFVGGFHDSNTGCSGDMWLWKKEWST